jgi:hypothetical protein
MKTAIEPVHIDGTQGFCDTGSPSDTEHYLLLEGNYTHDRIGPQQHALGLINETDNSTCHLGSDHIVGRYNAGYSAGGYFWLSDFSNAYGSYHKMYNNTCVSSSLFTAGAVSSLSTLVGGSGYSTASNVSVSGGHGSGLTFDTIASGGAVTQAIVHNQGSGYQAGDVVTFSGGGGNGTVHVAAIVDDTVSIQLTGVTYSSVMNNIFQDCVTNESPSMNLGVYSLGKGQVLTYSALAGGTGYSNASNNATTGGTGRGLTVDITTSGGVVTSVTIHNPGHGYTATTDTITISGGGGNATFTVASVADSTNSGGYNLTYQTLGTPIWVNPINSETGAVLQANPYFVGTTDFHLQSTSNARNKGGALTTVAAGDSGSGTTLVVSDAGFFQPGWAGTQGDWIAVGTVSNVAQITAINYSTNTITLASGITRSNGNSVWLYKNSSGIRVLYGTAPDIGAYEYVE